jgi:pimeloyl-ACP methyl ester carboxylesterase
MRMPGCPVGLLGLRLGGALGAMTAEEDPKIRCLVLWEPVLDGRSYLMLDLRKKLVKEMVAHGRARESRGALLEQLDRNARIDVDGYAVTARLYEELSAIALGGQTRRFRGALLIVQVSPAAALNAPLRRFAEAVPTARVETVAVRDPPFWNAIGVAQCPGLIEQTSRWLERSFARA